MPSGGSVVKREPSPSKGGAPGTRLMSAIVERVEGSAKATRGARQRFLYPDICTRSRKFSTTPSHERSGLRLPALASSMILMAIAYLTPSSQSPAAIILPSQKIEGRRAAFLLRTATA